MIIIIVLAMDTFPFTDQNLFFFTTVISENLHKDQTTNLR